ncbi:unnamed protein product [Peniophora sp. CBMAI 1063]|nr:unnamed protein product [Peniophora sp. CBMAI 1063]
MESIPARPGSPLPESPSQYSRATHLVPTRRAPTAPPSASRSPPSLARTKSSMNLTSNARSASSSPRAMNKDARAPPLARSRSNTDLPSLLASASPSASAPRPRPARHDNENLLAAFPKPPPLPRRTTVPLSMGPSSSRLAREKPLEHQAKRVTVSTTSSPRSPPPSRVAQIEEATLAPSPMICPALPVDLVPTSQRFLRRSPPRSPRVLREPKRGSPLKRGWSAEDMLREMEQEEEIDPLRGKENWFMQALQECAEEEDEKDYFDYLARPGASAQGVPCNCDSDSDEEEDPFHFDRNVTYRR